MQSDQPQIVQAVGVVGKEREDMPVTALSFAQRAALMLRDRRAEKLGERAAGCRRDRADRRLCAAMPRGSPLFPVHRSGHC